MEKKRTDEQSVASEFILEVGYHVTEPPEFVKSPNSEVVHYGTACVVDECTSGNMIENGSEYRNEGKFDGSVMNNNSNLRVRKVKDIFADAALSLFRHIDGDCKALKQISSSNFVADFILNAVFRGASQVCFIDNSVSGAVVLLALWVQSTEYLMFALIGLITGALFAHLLRFDSGLIRDGIFGYNSILVALGMRYFLTHAGSVREYFLLILAVVVMSALSTVFTKSFGGFWKPFGLSPLTLPFNYATLVFLQCATGFKRYPPAAFLTPALPFASAAEWIPWSPGVTIDAEFIINSTLRGVGQVYFADNAFSGGLMVVALGISSRAAALTAVCGSAVGILAAFFVGADFHNVNLGLWGYNSTLGALAINGVFYKRSTPTFAIAIFNAFFCAMLGGALSGIMAPFGQPTLTWPFCIGTLSFLLMGDKSTPLLEKPALTEAQHASTAEAENSF